MQAIANNLSKRFLDLHVFNTSKNNSIQSLILSDEEVLITMSEQCLERLIIKFRMTAVESDASKAKLLEFVENLKHECEMNHCMGHDNYVGA